MSSPYASTNAPCNVDAMSSLSNNEFDETAINNVAKTMSSSFSSLASLHCSSSTVTSG
eukprot:CAMPEP_0202708346 /NCGR_PEP_ID=MMETSP1385-20130828/20581_1 /ASSEMBLY_ACC=CAM_ASM_000861 /TAXON_ID=933848 /ORGANISM="Elphidium margaritaceum" /LENGTH=57 /DNA_ID=CAMNT_0049367299 /DNA_START=161 /DNA_END=330 /DNA_ORIENTATION=-